MKLIVRIIAIAALLLSSLPAHAMESHGNMKPAPDADSAKDMGFKHDTVVDGTRFEFQIMSLAAMKMKDDQGKTHHIMVKMFDEKAGTETRNAAGRIKIVGPDGTEQVNDLDNYSGILATNFSFASKGKYGVICLLKVDGQKKLVKFWYDHQG